MSQIENSRLVWFDGQGEPYKGTTASSIDVPLNYVIDQFRDAVKDKYADSHLKGIAPSDLLVYSNKAAFDRKDAPLSVREKIGEQLGSMDELYVVVPDEFQPSKKQRHDDVGLRELYDFSSIAGLTRLPNVDELPALLL